MLECNMSIIEMRALKLMLHQTKTIGSEMNVSEERSVCQSVEDMLMRNQQLITLQRSARRPKSSKHQSLGLYESCERIWKIAFLVGWALGMIRSKDILSQQKVK